MKAVNQVRDTDSSSTVPLTHRNTHTHTHSHTHALEHTQLVRWQKVHFNVLALFLAQPALTERRRDDDGTIERENENLAVVQNVSDVRWPQFNCIAVIIC